MLPIGYARITRLLASSMTLRMGRDKYWATTSFGTNCSLLIVMVTHFRSCAAPESWSLRASCLLRVVWLLFDARAPDATVAFQPLLLASIRLFVKQTHHVSRPGARALWTDLVVTV